MQLIGRQRIAVAAGVLAALASAPASAGAVTFGANLNNAPNATLTCEDGVPPVFLSGVGSQSCLWFSSSPTPYAPASGTVTAVHVRVGSITGPMQVVVMRSLYRNRAGEPGHPEFACCFAERFSPVFTPAANAITTVPTSLPVTEEPTPGPEDFSTIAAGDFLALSVLAPNVPIPVFVNNADADSGIYPAPPEGTSSDFPISVSTDLVGPGTGEVMLSADLDEGGGGGGGAGGAGGGGGNVPAPGAALTPIAPAPPTLTFPKLTIPIRNNTATVPIQCLVADCSGILNLQNQQLGGAARSASASSAKKRRKPKLVSYGTATFSLKAGAAGKVKVKLNRAGRKLVKSHKRTSVWANVRFTAGGGKPKSTRVTLKR